MWSNFYLLTLFVSVITALSNTEKLSPLEKEKQKKLVVPKMRNTNCKNIKCPPVENEICVKVKFLSPTARNKVIHIVMLNKCEIEYANCNQGMEAKIVPMKYCGDHNLPGKKQKNHDNIKQEDTVSVHNRSKRSASIGELGKQMQPMKKTIKTNSTQPKTLHDTKILKKISRQRMTSEEGIVNNNRLFENDSDIKREINRVTDTESETVPKKSLLNGDTSNDSDLTKFIFSDDQGDLSDLKQARDTAMLDGNMFKEPMFKTSVFDTDKSRFSNDSAEIDTADHKVETIGSDKSGDGKSDVTSFDKKSSGSDVAFTSDDDAKVTSSEVIDGDKKTSGSDVAFKSDDDASSEETSDQNTDGDKTSSGSDVAITSDGDTEITSDDVTDGNNKATGSDVAVTSNDDAKFTSSEVTDGDKTVTNERDYTNSNHAHYKAIDKEHPEVNANAALSSGSEEIMAGSNSETDGLLKESSGKEINLFDEPMFASPMFSENQNTDIDKMIKDKISPYASADETSNDDDEESSGNDQAARDENSNAASGSGSENYYDRDNKDSSTNKARGSSDIDNRADDSSRKEPMSGSDSKSYSSSGSSDRGTSNGSGGEWKKLAAGHVEDDVNYDYPIKEEVAVAQDDYTANCPSVCPAQATMVCARCADGIYKTFMSVCHMRMFSCKHPEEKIELVARAPCVLSAPYLSGMPSPRGLLREPQDEDKILKYINCRERGC